MSPHVQEWVGEGDYREDVSAMSDRTLMLRALHEAIGIRHDVGRLLSEVSVATRRLAVLEDRVTAIETQPYRAELPSSHDWDAMLVEAGKALSARVKDPRDKLDSNRARAIAQEVVDAASTVQDAKTLRAWKTTGGKIAIETLKVLLAAAVGALAVHYGFR